MLDSEKPFCNPQFVLITSINSPMNTTKIKIKEYILNPKHTKKKETRREEKRKTEEIRKPKNEKVNIIFTSVFVTSSVWYY